MTLCQTKTLTDSQKNRILSLVSQCCAYDAVSLSYPVSPKENASHFLLYSQKKGQPNLVSALALVPMDDSAMECIAFTHPDWRRRHYFSRLLSSALKSCHDQDLFFPVSGSSPDTAAALEALGAELAYQEHRMEIILPSSSQSVIPAFHAAHWNADSSCPPAFPRLKPPHSLYASPACWTLFLPDHPNHKAGSLLTSPIGSDHLCLHQVDILPDLKNQGYGTIMICCLLDYLAKTPIRKVSLQVSGENIPAMALYKKTGFQIAETLSYYLY